MSVVKNNEYALIDLYRSLSLLFKDGKPCKESINDIIKGLSDELEVVITEVNLMQGGPYNKSEYAVEINIKIR